MSLMAKNQTFPVKFLRKKKLTKERVFFFNFFRLFNRTASVSHFVCQNIQYRP